MDKKRILVTGAVVAALGLLIYFQFRHWHSFDWTAFWAEAHQIRLEHIVHAVLLIYIGYVLRAMRWKIFLRPVRPKSSWLGLVPATIVGFTGLALLGRPGEFIRPYLIARRENLPFSSQVAAWAVERIFDIGAFAVLLALAIFLPDALGSTPHPEYRDKLIVGGSILLGIVLVLAIGAFIISRKGELLASWFERRFSHWTKNLGFRIAQKIREFGAGLNTVHDLFSLLQLIAISLLMWYVIALAYHEVTIAYHHTFTGMAENPLDIPVPQILLLMGSSMVGSILQLPGVGGGSQLATIATLEHIFDVPKELALSCGIMLWLVTFVAVVPIGLVLARLEHLSLRRLSQESHQAPRTAENLPPSPPSEVVT
jgi:glycosyltransferase 2 family protein